MSTERQEILEDKGSAQALSNDEKEQILADQSDELLAPDKGDDEDSCSWWNGTSTPELQGPVSSTAEATDLSNFTSMSAVATDLKQTDNNNQGDDWSWETEDDSVTALSLAVFDKFEQLPPEVQQEIIILASRELAVDSLRSNRIIVGGPEEYQGLRSFTPSQSMGQLRAVSKSFRRNVEYAIFSKTLLVFDFDRDRRIFTTHGIDSHPWIAGQKLGDLDRVRNVYVVAGRDISDVILRDDHDQLVPANVHQNANFLLVVDYVTAIANKLPGIRKATVKLHFVYPVNAVLSTNDLD